MSIWPSSKAKKVWNALLRNGWKVKAQSGSHTQLIHDSFPEFAWAFHDSDEIGPKMFARIAKHTGLKPKDL